MSSAKLCLVCRSFNLLNLPEESTASSPLQLLPHRVLACGEVMYRTDDKEERKRTGEVSMQHWDGHN